MRGGSPASILCAACNGQYFATSLPIHQKTCFVRNAFINVSCPKCKTQIQSGRYHSHMETCPGTLTPVVTNTVSLKQVPEHDSVEEINEPEADGRIRCRKCGRGFNKDRILKHQTVCAGNKKKVEIQSISRKNNLHQPVTRKSRSSGIRIHRQTPSRETNIRSAPIKVMTPTIAYQPRNYDAQRYDLVHRDCNKTDSGFQNLSTSTASSSSNPLVTTKLMTFATFYSS